MMQVICNSGISRYGIAAAESEGCAAPILPPAWLIEGQHGAGDLAGLHRAEGFVDVAEAAALGDHAVEVEAALAVEFEIGRDVGAELVGAHARGLHLAFRADRHPRERYLGVGRQ